MRLPWLQIDADGQTRARLLSRFLGIPGPQAMGMAIELWHAAIEFSRDGDFSGAVPSPEFIAAACSWPVDDAARLVAALQQVGLVATHPELRVRGLDRYRRTWEKNRNFHRKASKSRSSVPSTGAMTANDGAEDEDEDEEVKDVPQPAPKKVRKPPKPSAAQELFAWLNATRATKTPLSDALIGVVLINTRFGEALNQFGRPAIERAYLAFLEQSEPGAMDPPWPWQSFLKRLPMLAARPPLAAVPKSRTLAPGEDPYADQLA